MLSSPATPPPVESLHSQLRQRSREQHRQLETSESMSLLFSPALTQLQYARHLQQQLGFIDPLETRLAAWLESPLLATGGWQFEPRATSIRTDLEQLGYTSKVAPARGAELPAINSPYAALGSLYVLEGSRLGGQVISRQLQQTLGETLPRHYYNSAAADPQRWKRFLQLLQAPYSSTEQDMIVSAAISTFERFHHWLSTSPLNRTGHSGSVTHHERIYR